MLQIIHYVSNTNLYRYLIRLVILFFYKHAFDSDTFI
jgi:hypothetical protein